MMIKFLNVAIVTVIAAFVFEYSLMPLIHSYVGPAAALGLMLVPAGLLMTRPCSRSLRHGLLRESAEHA